MTFALISVCFKDDIVLDLLKFSAILSISCKCGSTCIEPIELYLCSCRRRLFIFVYVRMRDSLSLSPSLALALCHTDTLRVTLWQETIDNRNSLLTHRVLYNTNVAGDNPV